MKLTNKAEIKNESCTKRPKHDKSYKKQGSALAVLLGNFFEYRITARKFFLGTDGYWVPAKFSMMRTPDLAKMNGI